MLKAVTLYEPWASLMFLGAKRNETRGQRTHHRGEIAIHSAKTDHGVSEQTGKMAIAAFKARGYEVPFAHYGKIVALVDIVDCLPSELFSKNGDKLGSLNFVGHRKYILSEEEWAFGDYSPGRFIYVTRNLRRLHHPVACKGAQPVGWTVPPDIEAQVRAQI